MKGAEIELRSIWEDDTAAVPRHEMLSEEDADAVRFKKLHLIVGYAMSMGLCGMILVAIGQTLSELAKDVGFTAEQIGSVFIARGIGAVSGSLLSAQLYHDYPGNLVISSSELALGVSVFLLPFNRSIMGLHALFFIIGLGTAITDTGCQILTRKLHGDTAGPYLGLNTVAFGISGSLIPAFTFFFEDIYMRCSMLALIIISVLVTMLLCPDPISLTNSPAADAAAAAAAGCMPVSAHPARQPASPSRRFSHNSEGTMAVHSPQTTWRPSTPQRTFASTSSRHSTPNESGGEEDGIKSPSLSSSDTSGAARALATESSTVLPRCGSNSNFLNGEPKPPHFFVETFIALMVFCLIGGQVTVTAYLEAYAAQTHIIGVGAEHKLMLLFWVCVTLGRVVGIKYQMTFTDQTLVIHLFTAAFFGSAAGMVLYLFTNSASLFWLCIPVYGFCNGPCLGFCYDLNNRLTYPTETSMAIVMFGLNLGASLVPYLTSLAWRESLLGPNVLLLTVLLSCLIPLPLLFFAAHCGYVKSQPPSSSGHNHLLHYHSIEQDI